MPQDLKRRTKQFSLSIIQLCSVLKKNQATRILGNQLLRSATSIGANYREADMAHSPADFVAKISICLKEASETCYWLELLIESNNCPLEQARSLLLEATELTKILFSIRRNSRREN